MPARGSPAYIRFIAYLVAGCVGAYALFLASAGMGKSLWLDEAWVANSATAPSWAEVFYYPAWLQTSPPLFLLLVRASIAVFGLTNAAFRTTPLLMGVLAGAAMGLAARQLLPRWQAVLAWTMVALSPVALHCAGIVKQYSCELAAATVVLSVWAAYLRRPSGRRFGMLAGTVVVSLLAAYPIALAVPGITLAVWLSGGGRPVSRAVTLALAAGSVFTAEYYFLVLPNTSPALHAFWGHADGNFGRVALASVADILRLLPVPDRWAGSGIAAAAVGGLMLVGFGLAGLRFRSGRPKWLQVQMVCAAPCVLAILCQWFSWYPVSERTALFLLPFVAVLLTGSLGMVAVLVRSRWWTIAWIAATLACIFVGVRKSPVARQRTPEEDVESAVAFLHGHVRQGDVLWVDASASESFKLYARILHWSDPPARFGNTGWPCCPRGVEALKGAGTEEGVRRDVDAGIPAGERGQVWLLYTTRAGNQEFAGVDESRITRTVLKERGCVEGPVPRFYNMGVSSFDCRTAPYSLR